MSVLFALVLSSSATSAVAGAPVGAWSGKLVPRERTYTVPAVTLVVGASTVRTTYVGLTGAAHDSPTATTTCSVTFRYVGEQSGWMYYEQAAPSRLTAAGVVEGASCGADGRRSAGGIGYLLRLHSPQGGKLAVEVTTWDRAPKSLADTVDALKYLRARGYLTR